VDFKGIILAGGKSSRFGKDKALAKWEGRTLLERAVDLLESLRLNPVVVTSGEKDYSFLSCPVEKDLIPSKGPLGGLYTACCIFKNAPLAVLTCDMPNLTPELLKMLLDSHRKAFKVTLLKTKRNRFQPFPGIYEPSLIDRIRKVLEAGDWSMQDFLQQVSEINLIPFKGSQEVFLNVNFQHQIGEVSKTVGT